MSFLIDWIPKVWDIQSNWGTTWLVGCILIACLGIMVAGYAAVKLDDWEMFPPFIAVPILLAAFWPIAVIALPFIAIAAGLFVGGMAIAHNAEDESDEEEPVKKRPDWAGY